MPNPNPENNGAEAQRLIQDASRQQNWKRWGPYLSERQWATVREDYSAEGTCWDYFPHDHARSRAYRWGEDGLLGITDRECRLCFALALWNGNDPILKERLFGLTGTEGNHGEDVKEEYYYLDSTPTHSYSKALYKYPHAAFPYEGLLAENKKRNAQQPEYELVDTSIFKENRYHDVQVEYAKNAPDDILIRITVSNRGPDTATLHLLPNLWFRNTWSWGEIQEESLSKPTIKLSSPDRLKLEHETLQEWSFEVISGNPGGNPEFLFTDNETNFTRLFQSPNLGPFVKDAFHDYLIKGLKFAIDAENVGTKVAAHYALVLKAGDTQQLRFRLNAAGQSPAKLSSADFDQICALRIKEADEFYASKLEPKLTPAERNVARQAYAGLLWSKQFYNYEVKEWLQGDPKMPKPPAERWSGRNANWQHVYSRNVLSMPDKWEYPWFAAWDLAFHMITFAKIDSGFAKEQLGLLLREWYMHPNGQIPAYEFAFSDVNPPMQAWAAWRIYKLADCPEQRDRDFLESQFQKLLLNFTWWVNRKDPDGKNLFGGGFLGLDNIGVFDRSKMLPDGGEMQQADGTAWMAFYCSTMLAIAIELSHGANGRVRKPYEDMASKFLEHFVQIADAINTFNGSGLWDETDGFYYDQIKFDGHTVPLKTRSLVGLLPLIAVEVLPEDRIVKLPGFYKRFQWFQKYRQDLKGQFLHLQNCSAIGQGGYLLTMPSKPQLIRLLRYMFDESEFLSPYGLRSISKFHEQHPYVFQAGGATHSVNYEPGESQSALFGGNSNWRGPVWFPINYLIIEALERYHHFYGDDFKVECPVGSGKMLTLRDAARELAVRQTRIFLPDAAGRRPCFGDDQRYAKDPNWRDLLLFNEYFNGDNGKGLGASHQTGWTALVVRYLDSLARHR